MTYFSWKYPACKNRRNCTIERYGSESHFLHSANIYIFFFLAASRAAPHVAPPPGIVEIDSEKFACQW